MADVSAKDGSQVFVCGGGGGGRILKGQCHSPFQSDFIIQIRNIIRKG